ncbi:MAG: hypothetical protein FD170_3897 [Bacteroidetes bacterium]|nr:MAG: hypothetical protein FD170_3897 [Bacteroidota bacterium]
MKINLSYTAHSAAFIVAVSHCDRDKSVYM